jgi:pimeloyl-ACP methyl ester carboxylesterase
MARGGAELNGAITLLMAASVSFGANAAAQQAAATADPALIPYASAKNSVRLPDGRTLHLVCMGRGSPTVILTTGANGWSIGWYKVQPAVAASTRVCAWDRAGYGLSTGVPQPQTVDESTSDLQAALKAGHVAGPYVVVGVSLGGDESLLLKDRDPAEVVGMVLVDPSFPDQVETEQRAMSPELKAWGDTHPPPFIPFLQKCVAALRAGTLRRGGPDPDGCLHAQWPPDYPPELRAALDRQIAEATPAALASAMEGMTSGGRLNALNSKIVMKPGRNYGNMPLIVLTAEMGGPPGMPAELWSQAKLVLAEERRAHQELAALSRRGAERLVPDSPHDITSFRPQLVIDAIDEVVDDARATGAIDGR